MRSTQMPRFAPILLGCLFLTASSHGQQTRHGLLRQQREEKRARVAPHRLNPVEKQLLSFDKAETPSIAEWSVKGFYPRIA